MFSENTTEMVYVSQKINGSWLILPDLVLQFTSITISELILFKLRLPCLHCLVPTVTEKSYWPTYCRLFDAGPVIALRGDRIRCTVMFENEQTREGKVPVLFTVNGRKIMIYTHDGKDPEIFIDSGKLPCPYIAMNDGCSVLAKVRALHEHWSKSSTRYTNRLTRVFTILHVYSVKTNWLKKKEV